MYRQGYINSDIPETMKEVIADIQYLKIAITDEVINTKLEEIIAEYTGEELIPKEIANKRIVELYEELWYYNIEKSKYTELALIEKGHGTFLEAIQNGKDFIHCIIIEKIVGYIVELKIADGI